MAKIVTIHSFLRGTGKSNIAANVAALMALAGQRVGVIDIDVQSPSIHLLFGLSESQMAHSLNDYLWGRCDIEQAAYDATPRVEGMAGRIFVIPSSVNASAIAQMLRQGYEAELLHEGFQRLIEAFRLDTLVVDAPAGLSAETLLSLALSDALAIVLRLDKKDYQGTAVTVEVARNLDVPRLALVVNMAPPAYDPAEVVARVEETYHCPVAAVIPHAEPLLALASADLFVLRYPDHPVTTALHKVKSALVAP